MMEIAFFVLFQVNGIMLVSLIDNDGGTYYLIVDGWNGAFSIHHFMGTL